MVVRFNINERSYVVQQTNILGVDECTVIQHIQEILISIRHQVETIEHRCDLGDKKAKNQEWNPKKECIYKKSGSEESTVEEEIAIIKGTLFTLNSINQFQNLDLDLKERLQKEIEQLQLRLQRVISNLMVYHSPRNMITVSLSDILKKVKSTRQVTRNDIEKVMMVSYSGFMKDLVEFQDDEKAAAYRSLIPVFLNDCKNDSFKSSAFAREVAEKLHNLVNDGLNFGWEVISDDSFWDPIFQSKTKNYFLEHFFIGLVRSMDGYNIKRKV